MYKNILVCLDNSEYATAGIDLALGIASKTGALVTGCHVYAARLHDMRFRQMEGGLPPEYQNPVELKRQREVHDDLITKGLKVISDSYMAVLETRARLEGVKVASVQREGRNFSEILNEIGEGGYDLVVLGAMGLGRTAAERIGSVAERVVRSSSTDVLVVRDTVLNVPPAKKVYAAVDGSPRSFGALKRAFGMAEVFSTRVEAIGAYDPDYHHAAFRSIASVLTEEAGRLFKFNEQERLHSEIIDNGLEKIYSDHLKAAAFAAIESGHRIDTKLLAGKPVDEIVGYIKRTSPFLIVLGRSGIHSDQLNPGSHAPEIGSVAENTLREAHCNVLITSYEAAVPADYKPDGQRFEWSPGAVKVLDRVPLFARGVAKKMVEEAAKKERITKITVDYMRVVRKRMGF